MSRTAVWGAAVLAGLVLGAPAQAGRADRQLTRALGSAERHCGTDDWTRAAGDLARVRGHDLAPADAAAVDFALASCLNRGGMLMSARWAMLQGLHADPSGPRVGEGLDLVAAWAAATGRPEVALDVPTAAATPGRSPSFDALLAFVQGTVLSERLQSQDALPYLASVPLDHPFGRQAALARSRVTMGLGMDYAPQALAIAQDAASAASVVYTPLDQARAAAVTQDALLQVARLQAVTGQTGRAAETFGALVDPTNGGADRAVQQALEDLALLHRMAGDLPGAMRWLDTLSAAQAERGPAEPPLVAGNEVAFQAALDACDLPAADAWIAGQKAALAAVDDAVRQLEIRRIEVGDGAWWAEARTRAGPAAAAPPAVWSHLFGGVGDASLQILLDSIEAEQATLAAAQSDWAGPLVDALGPTLEADHDRLSAAAGTGAAERLSAWRHALAARKRALQALESQAWTTGQACAP